MTEAEERQKEREEDKKLIEEWLAKGNKITVYPYGARSEEIEYTTGMYAKRKKKGANKKTKK